MDTLKTYIIGINMHGEIHLQDNGNLYSDIVPAKMNIHIISAVAPGIPFISTLKNSENMIDKVSTSLKQIKNWNKLTNISKIIRDLLVDTNKKESNNIVKEHQHLYSKNKPTYLFQKFANYYDNSFRIKTYCSGDAFVDKLFIKFSEGQVINPYNVPEKYFNKLTILNSKYSEDLFEILKLSGLDIEQIRLSELIEFLANIGVKNLIIVDLSCSIFKGELENLTERNIRYLRRQMLK